MQLFRKKSDQLQIAVSQDELLVINNALNEICYGIEIYEFSTRIGKDKEFAEKLLKKIGTLCKNLHN